MKTKWILLVVSIMCTTWMLHADETITVTATSSDISENLNLKTVATLFGQAKDLEEFESMINNPDSAFSNLDLNGDGEVDYLRVIETADNNKHLVVIQAVLAKDVYQDVASIFVEKDEATQSVTVQVIGDEYIYGTNYIIEPVYIYRPLIYDWFWSTAWVCWHSPYYWDYWPTWWRPYHYIDPYLYWDRCHWHHYHYPICTYRTVHHPHRHFHHMHHGVKRNDYAIRHPERSFATRNASRNITNASSIEQSRRAELRQTTDATRSRVSGGTTATRQSTSVAGATRNNTYGSSNVRTSSTSRTQRAATTTTNTRSTSVSTTSTTRANTTATSPSRSTSTSVTRSSSTTPTRSSSTTVRTTSTTPTRSSSTSVRTTSTTPTRSSSPSVRSTTTTTRSSSSYTPSSTRSSSSSTMRSTGGGSTMRSSGGSMRTTSSGGSRTR